MAECIERKATIKRIKEVYCAGCNSYNGVRCRACATGDAIDIIEDAPAADVAPVVYGRWIPFHSKISGDIQYCSACEIGFAAKADYCPHCGAKMDGGADHAAD